MKSIRVQWTPGIVPEGRIDVRLLRMGRRWIVKVKLKVDERTNILRRLWNARVVVVGGELKHLFLESCKLTGRIVRSHVTQNMVWCCMLLAQRSKIVTHRQAPKKRVNFMYEFRKAVFSSLIYVDRRSSTSACALLSPFQLFLLRNDQITIITISSYVVF